MSRLLIVSNRLPVTIRNGDVEPSSGGLATAMRGPHERGDSLWIGWPGDRSRLTAEAREATDRALAAMRTVPVDLSAAEISRFYDGFSNSVLWPLFHYLIDKVQLDARRSWDAYREVNERFAATIAEHHRPGDLVWIHDYQLALVPQLLRARIRNARIGFFLHIPFPSSEVFRLLPWREAILRGLLGADYVGFHTASYRHNFALSAARVIGLEPNLDELEFEDRTVGLGVHPISIDAAEFVETAQRDDVIREAETLRPPGCALVLGVDRLDYTKGIRRRLLALERFFEIAPEFRERVRYVQVAVPTREKVDAYAQLRREVNELVGRINGHHGSLSAAPIHLVHRSITREQLVALYRAADVMMVTPLRDGMNLVAKEYVASKVDDSGALVLSEFAGAADELTDALLVNPYDLDSVAHALERALEMPEEEKRRRMRGLRRKVLQHDVHAWAREFLDSLAAKTSNGGSVATSRADAVEREIASAQRVDLFLDYDGTLTPIVDTPELAAPDAELRELLVTLARAPGTRVHVVSGRGRDDLARLLDGLPVDLHAEHGFWSRAVGGDWVPYTEPKNDWMPHVRPLLARFAERTPGAFVEEKTTSLAWHYRLADPELASARVREMKLAMMDVLRERGLELLAGVRVVEVRPRGVGKALAARSRRKDALTVAVGDDATDEDLFAALPSDALTVRVGSGVTRARHRVQSPDDVRALLRVRVARGGS